MLAKGRATDTILSQRLLLSVADQLKMPLLQIARQAEQAQLSGTPDLVSMQATADAALRLVDSYALGVRMQLDPQSIELEPVTVSSILYDTGQALNAHAKSYGIDLELSITGHHGPVMAYRKGLEAALVSLGSALIEALPALQGPQLKLQLATHRSRYGIVAGIYADTKQFSHGALQKGRQLQPQSRQPMLSASHTSGAGIFVADALLQAMNFNLTASRHAGLHGYGTVLQPNRQMQLV